MEYLQRRTLLESRTVSQLLRARASRAVEARITGVLTS